MSLGRIQPGGSHSKAAKKAGKKANARKMTDENIALQQRKGHGQKSGGKFKNAIYIDGPLSGQKVG